MTTVSGIVTFGMSARIRQKRAKRKLLQTIPKPQRNRNTHALQKLTPSVEMVARTQRDKVKQLFVQFDSLRKPSKRSRLTRLEKDQQQAAFEIQKQAIGDSWTKLKAEVPFFKLIKSMRQIRPQGGEFYEEMFKGNLPVNLNRSYLKDLDVKLRKFVSQVGSMTLTQVIRFLQMPEAHPFFKRFEPMMPALLNALERELKTSQAVLDSKKQKLLNGIIFLRGALPIKKMPETA